MATYYVRTDGNDGNTGLGSGTGQAWATIGKALGATGITGGDTVFIAPGTYREVVTISGTYSSATYIYGNPTASQFVGVTAGEVRITPSGSDNIVSTSYALTATSKNNLNFRDLIIGGMNATTCTNLTIERCLFFSTSATTSAFMFTGSASVNFNTVIKQSIFNGTINGIQYNYRNSSTAQNYGFALSDCVLTGENAILFTDQATPFNNFVLSGVNIYNCVLMGSTPFRTIQTHISATGNTIIVNNSLIYATGTYAFQSNTNIAVTENFNRVYGVNTRQNVSQGANTNVASWAGLEFGQSLLQGFNPIQIFGNTFNSPNATAGTASGAPAVDMYGQSWNVTPDIGVAIYRTIGGVGAYLPAAQAAGTLTIAPGSTSQSIELYLGATGLTASTSGLSAYYNRTRSADVQINLQARNITQNWTSGGFAEVNPNTMPGVYRLDIPNEALAAGADDVTVVVRGASGTNGAVISIKLSSGGLTTAQTASAVWGALTNDHTTHGTFGWNVLRADQDSKEGLVTLHQSGGISRVDADIHAIANDTAAATALKGALNHDGTGYVDSDVVRISTSTAAANELEGALLHNGTDYIDSNLIGGNSTRVFVGRFQLTQTGTTQGDIIEAFTTDTPSFELQLFDGDNNIVPVTGATLGLRILDVTSTVVETGTPTIEYGTGGIVRWTAPGSYVSIGCPAGMYRLFVDRTVSGTTTTFGPLQIKVQVQ